MATPTAGQQLRAEEMLHRGTASNAIVLAAAAQTQQLPQPEPVLALAQWRQPHALDPSVQRTLAALEGPGQRCVASDR